MIRGHETRHAQRDVLTAVEDGSLWMYEYNGRDELTGARRCWSDWAPVAGQQFGYTFDNIGNRVSARWGGDAQGASLRETVYTANSLNQYTEVQTPGYKPIAGVALATNSVTVNGAIADRKVEHFHREVTVANSSGPVWQNVEVISATATNGGGFVSPKNQQALTYDLDGNLSFGGVWVYEWDGENRLRAMTMTNISGIPNAQRKRLEFAYDFMSRRMTKTVKTWTGSSFGNAVTNRFVYDLPMGEGGGWNLIAVLGSQSSVLQSFLWGQDLSGTMSGAGGVGGLLAVCDQSTINDQPSTHFAAYDGNGSIMGLINAGDRSTSARYEYSPFGELLRSTGSMAEADPFRFSTKYVDDETGLIYYGYRYYSPALGRWTGRDPKEEAGLNLLAFLKNRPVSCIDSDGRDMFDEASALLNGALWAMRQYRPGSREWMDIYAQTQRTLWPALLSGAMVYSGPWSILQGIMSGSTTVAEAWAVSRGATAVAVGGAIVTAASIGVVIGYVGGELAGAMAAEATFMAEAFVDYWASPDTVIGTL